MNAARRYESFFSYCSDSIKGELLAKRTITEWAHFNMKPSGGARLRQPKGKCDDRIELTGNRGRIESEARKQRSEAGSQKSEVGSERTEPGG